MSSNLWGSLLDSLKDVAPALATAAGTVVGGPLAGGVLGALARKLTGAGADVSLDDIAADILGDPEKQQQFRIESRKLELEELKLRTMDVASARQTLKMSLGASVISTVVVTGYLGAVVLAMTAAIPAASQNLAYLLLGNLGTGFGMVLTFWLGSSVGSKEKDQINLAYAEAAKADQAARRRK